MHESVFGLLILHRGWNCRHPNTPTTGKTQTGHTKFFLAAKRQLKNKNKHKIFPFRSIMTVESNLGQALNICFIDARSVVTEAKLNLGIFGYASAEQQKLLFEEATAIFYNLPLEEQHVMHQKKTELEDMILQGSAGRKCSSQTTLGACETSRSSVNSDVSVNSSSSSSSATCGKLSFRIKKIASRTKGAFEACLHLR